MKTKFCILIAVVFSVFETTNAQTLPSTPDLVALPTPNCSGGGTTFPAPANYSPIPGGVQLGVNNTGTDICTEYGTGKVFQAMVWDNVTTLTSQTNFISNIYLSWNYMDAPVSSFVFPIPGGEKGGFDPDVAIFSDTNGTFIEVVFENNTTGKIDGYSFRWNGSTFVPYASLAFKSTLCHDATKKAKNPNIAATKNGGRIAVVWHEEGLVNPPQTLTITYSTTPPTTYTNTVSLLESKVYIYSVDKPGYLGDLLGSPTSSPIRNFAGVEVIRTAPSNSYHLFDRNFNPDVSFSEEAFNINVTPTQNVISVTFLSQYFDPSTFSIVTGQLSVVQGTTDHFINTTPTSILTPTVNFTTAYSGKPRIAARLSQTGTYTAKDFAVVMGNSVTVPGTCGSPSSQSSKIHKWWVNTGGAVCPTGGVDLLPGSGYEAVTSIDPVISCVNGRGWYDVVFATNRTGNFDVIANTYVEGSLVTAGSFSTVNYGSCSATQAGYQVLPSVASVRKLGAPLTDNALSNYLFWDQYNKSLDFKKITTVNIPGGGVALRQSQNQIVSQFKAYPNPADNEIVFDFNLSESEVASEIEIYNMLGQSVDKFSVVKNSTEQKRDVNKMPSGTYVAILKTNIKNYKFEFIKK